MSSDFETFCNELIADLTVGVAGLGTVTVHTPAPWDPEELVNDGERHLAVWPLGESEGRGEDVEPLHMSADNILQAYRVLVWEPSTDTARQVLDPEAASAFLTLHNQVRARFYAGFSVAGWWKIRYRGVTFPDRTTDSRWFAIDVTAWTAVAYD